MRKCLKELYPEVYAKAIKLPKLKVTDIYNEAVKTLPKDHIDHYGLGHGLDDLHLKFSPEALEIIFRLRDKSHMITTFIDQTDGSLWLDIPFAYPLTD